MKFTEFNLSDDILRSLEEMGFEEATEIQNLALPFLMNNPNRDFVGLAQTGTGKTAAFGLPLIQDADTSVKTPGALILSPTRELCLQIAGELELFSKHSPGIRITSVYGGASIGEQIGSLRRGTQIVVATPGRLVDLLRRGNIDLSALKQLVLDEADIMLNMGFKEELDRILESTPEDKRVVLLSATMPPEVARIAAEYMTNPHEVKVGAANSSTATIEHLYAMVHSREKYQALKRILDYNPDIYGMVFCRTKISTQQIADRLVADGYNSAAIHGDLSQNQRDQVMAAFRDKSVRILVATDVAARGIDVESITHVIQYDLPDEAENYVHRSGRTGRAGKTGVSIALINMKERGRLRHIERLMKGTIVRLPIPSGQEICDRQLLHLIDRVHSVEVDEERIAPHMAIIEEKLAALDREELLKHFVSLEFNRFLSYYRDAADLNPVEDSRGGRDGGRNGRRDGDGRRNRERRSNDEFVTLRVNVGRKDRVNPPQIIALVNEATNMNHIEIGKIIIEDRSSTVMIDQEYSELVTKRVNETYFRGRPVVATPEGSAGKRSRGNGPRRDARDGGDRPYDGQRQDRSRSGRRSNSSNASNSRGKGKGGYKGGGKKYGK